MPDFPGAWSASGGRQRDGLVCRPWRRLPLMDPLVGATHPVSPDDRSTHLFRCCSYIQHCPPLAAAYPHALNNCTAQTLPLQFECIPMNVALQNYILRNSHYTFTASTFCDTEHNISSCLCPVCLCFADMIVYWCKLRKGVLYANIKWRKCVRASKHLVL